MESDTDATKVDWVEMVFVEVLEVTLSLPYCCGVGREDDKVV